MKTCVLIFSIVSCCFLFLDEPTVTFYSSGIKTEIITRSFSDWSFLKIKFKRVINEENAILVIKLLNKNELTDPKRFAEYQDNKIRINNRYSFKEEDLKQIISHEFGHFLGLDHSNEPQSIMNNKSPLQQRIVTKQDIKNSKKLWIVKFCKIRFYNLKTLFSSTP